MCVFCAQYGYGCTEIIHHFKVNCGYDEKLYNYSHTAAAATVTIKQQQRVEREKKKRRILLLIKLVSLLLKC